MKTSKGNPYPPNTKAHDLWELGKAWDDFKREFWDAWRQVGRDTWARIKREFGK